MPLEIWLWQTIVCPLWAGLAASLANRGHRVRIIAMDELSADRRALGWSLPDCGAAEVQVARDPDAARKRAAGAGDHIIHVCQGVRSNRAIADAQAVMRARGARQLALFETIDDAGWRGPLKQLMYRRLFSQILPRMDGLLAIGDLTPRWLAGAGVPPHKIHPFAYFIADSQGAPVAPRPADGRFRLLFVGQLIERKRLDLLIQAIGSLRRTDIDLEVIGSGEQAEALRALGERVLGPRLIWRGVMPRETVPARMAEADCLVLPSRHDGWGAVVSEALLSGVPAIASDHCGVAGIIRASGHGGIFPVGDLAALAALIDRMAAAGPLPAAEREALARWSRCIGSGAGADYLLAIASELWERGPAAVPPWAAQPLISRDVVAA